MTKNEEKDKIQSHAVTLSESYPSLLLQFATGVGKSLAAIKIIERNQEQHWFILCKEVNHINNWLDEFKTHGKEHLLDNVTIFCYDSLHKYIGTKANLVLDEGHAITEKRLELIKQIASEKVIILSATITDDKLELLRQIKGTINWYSISISDAIKKGLLPAPKVYIVDVELTPEQRKKYNIINNTVEYYKMLHFQKQEKWTEFKWLNTALKRKNLLAEFKQNKAQEVLKKLEDKRLVCFTGSIKQCESLGGKYVVHFKARDNQKIIAAFNEGKIDKLFAVNMLREAMNLTNIQAGIIIQLDNKKLSFIQMLGRVFRADLPECYVLVVKETQDEVYLKTVLEGFDKKYLYKYE